MKKLNYFFLSIALLFGVNSQAQQRYVDEVFSASDIVVESNVTYATNIDFLTSDFSSQPQTIADLTEIKTALARGQAIPGKFFDPRDASSNLKVRALQYDIYYPNTTTDTASARPVAVYLHTGNFLPPGINGSPLGSRSDSLAVNVCKALAMRGYVAVSASYRLGWNPIAATPQERKGTLLNAVYRSIHDVKMCIRGLRVEAAGTNKYKIDSDNFFVIGEGTGAYIANSYGTLTRYPEMELPRFINPLTSSSYIDTATVGLLSGYGGLLNLYAPVSASSDVKVTVALGGAMPDTSWIEAGEPAMIGFQCVRDPFAPFNDGTVIVPTTQEDVVDVQGSNLYIKKANALGNNDALMSSSINGAYSDVARSRYGQTYDYIFPSPRDKMTVTADNENQFAVVRPLGASLFQNEASPWQWWDPESAIAKQVVDPNTGATAHLASLSSNPMMSPAQGRAYIDTIMGYMCPRVMNAFGYNYVTIKEVNLNSTTNIYPNPAQDMLTVELENGVINTIQILDMNGKVSTLVSGLNTHLHEVSTLNLTNGIYTVLIETDRGTVSKRVQVIH